MQNDGNLSQSSTSRSTSDASIVPQFSTAEEIFIWEEEGSSSKRPIDFILIFFVEYNYRANFKVLYLIPSTMYCFLGH